MLDVKAPNAGEYVIIDAVNFVCAIDSFKTDEMATLDTSPTDLLDRDLSDDQINTVYQAVIDKLSMDLSKIFGDKFAKLHQKGLGIHYYKYCYQAKTDTKEILINIGLGGQNNTVFFGLTGFGCKVADKGWEVRLQTYLATLQNPRITRIDLAHDDLDGAYSSFAKAYQADTDDKFILPKTRNRPSVTVSGEFKHNDPQNKGLTMYVGSRKNGKIMRCYEKGKQLGDKKSKWFRSELEIHGKKRVIPFDVLTKPTSYFIAAYPYNKDLIDAAKKHFGDCTPLSAVIFPSVKREAQITLCRAIQVLKHQFGRYIKAFGDIFTLENYNFEKIPDYKGIFNRIKTDKQKDYYPKRLSLTMHVFKDDLGGVNVIKQQIKQKAKSLRNAFYNEMTNPPKYYDDVSYQRYLDNDEEFQSWLVSHT